VRLSISNSKGIRILLVDDELANLRLLIEFLQNREFSIAVAQNGGEGLRIATDLQPELILLDVRMPDMDGFTFYHQLLANPKTADTLVIFLSAINDINYKEQALNFGGADYVTKPIDERELLARIYSHLGRQRQYRSALTRLLEQELRIDKGCTMCISKILPVLKLHYDKGNKPSFNCKLYTSNVHRTHHLSNSDTMLA
jgi:DNA-binding response OmpR family regulator